MGNNTQDNEYTLSALFSGDRKIVIPDLQRDYCWGDPDKTLVRDFVNNLIQSEKNIDESDTLNLGVVYGYEQPKGHIQLCDGQQRITTLFLLLGMLNRKSADNEFKQLLISDFELERDDKEPYLQYAIRESSLYFLSDLVCQFFLTSDIATVSEIEKSPWYFNEYRHDPSIQSMLHALTTIESLLADQDEQWCKRFGNFITTKLRLLYVDLENRSNGEETFVVINTTGEPLSATQNLKPLVCEALINAEHAKRNNIYEQWEDMENWFWLKRLNGNDTADAGMKEFMRWVAIINANADERGKLFNDKTDSYDFSYETIPFKEIFGYWQGLHFLYDTWAHRDKLDSKWLSPTKKISQIDCFQIIPLVVYCQHWQISDPDDHNLYRFYRFIENLRHVQKVRSNAGDMVGEAIKAAKRCRDIIELANTNKDEISETLLSAEEIRKLIILREDAAQREATEQAFWRAQALDVVDSHHIWSGQIMPLLKWATDSDKFSLQAFERYLGIFDTTFDGKCEGNIDQVRRALLTRGLKDYPRIFRGYTVYSLGWDWYEWQILINDNLDIFKAFFDDLLAGVSLQEMIDNYPQREGLAAMVHEPELLAFCEQKQLQWTYGNWYLMCKKYFSGAHANISAYAYFCYLKSNSVLAPTGWKRYFYGYDLTCVYYEYERKGLPNVAFDIYWNGGSSNNCLRFDLFERDEDYARTKAELQPVANVLGYDWDDKDNRYRKYVVMDGKSEKELASIADKESADIFAQTKQHLPAVL